MCIIKRRTWHTLCFSPYLPANNVPDSLDRQARGSTTEGTMSQPLSHGMDTVYTYESHQKVETCKKKENFKKEETISVSDVEEEESISEKDDEEV